MMRRPAAAAALLCMFVALSGAREHVEAQVATEDVLRSKFEQAMATAGPLTQRMAADAERLLVEAAEMGSRDAALVLGEARLVRSTRAH